MGQLPDFYATVADEMLEWCQPATGVWMDLGAGAGGLGLALAPRIAGTVMLVDPNCQVLMNALDTACRQGCHGRVVAVEGSAEQLPLPSSSVDYVVSRGSIFFWADQAQGLREVYRVLRPGGRAMIGGGLGSHYPDWARQEFIRRQRANGPGEDTPEAQEFRRLRHPDTFRVGRRGGDSAVYGDGCRRRCGALSLPQAVLAHLGESGGSTASGDERRLVGLPLFLHLWLGHYAFRGYRRRTDCLCLPCRARHYGGNTDQSRWQAVGNWLGTRRGRHRAGLVRLLSMGFTDRPSHYRLLCPRHAGTGRGDLQSPRS